MAHPPDVWLETPRGYVKFIQIVEFEVVKMADEWMVVGHDAHANCYELAGRFASQEEALKSIHFIRMASGEDVLTDDTQ